MRWLLFVFLWHCSSGRGLCRGSSCGAPTVTPAMLTVPSGASTHALAISATGAVTTDQSWATVSGSGDTAMLVLSAPPCGASDVTLTVANAKLVVHLVVEDAISALVAAPASLTLLRGGQGTVVVQKVSGACPAKAPLTAVSALQVAIVDSDASASVTISAASDTEAPARQTVAFTCGAAAANFPVTVSNEIAGTFAEGGVGWTVSVDGTAYTAGAGPDGTFKVFVDAAPYSLTVQNHNVPRVYRYKSLTLAAPLLPASLSVVATPSEARVHVSLPPVAGVVAAFSLPGAHGDWYSADAAGWSGSDGAPSASDGPDARWRLGSPQIAGWLDVLQTQGGFALARVPVSLLNGAATSAQAALQPVAAQNAALSAQLPSGYAMDARMVFAVVDPGAGLPVSADPSVASVALPSGARMAVSASAKAVTRDLFVFIADADPTQPLALAFPSPVTDVPATASPGATIAWSGPAAAYAVDVLSGATIACSAWSMASTLALNECNLKPGSYTLQVTAIGPATTLDNLAAGIADPSRFGTRVPNASNFFAIAAPVAFTVTP